MKVSDVRLGVRITLVLLGMRSSNKIDIGASSVDLAYGTSLRLPVKVFRHFHSPYETHFEFLANPRHTMQQLRLSDPS
ncbi:hypothetical protein NPIL_244911 [Nephila pilipes]|uniref:Uncharacterized protein n=1 Tax=Nephila pilipes TaxID=299642 RepID=A0A8X6NSI8_NEPPI|nr:hypothetical protein NPIL_244911 [Nephila pilipes]